MSFASGLFSFLGGAATQFREEIDLENARKAAKAKADAEAIAEQARLNEEVRQFNITTDIDQQKVDVSRGELELKKDTEKRLAYEFEKDYGFRLNEFEWEKNVYNKDYTLARDKHLLNKKDIEERLKLATNKDERDAILLELKEEEFEWSKKQDEIQNQFDIDELEFEKYKLEVETHADTLKAMEEAEEGQIDFGNGLIFKKGTYSATEQPIAFLSWMNQNITKEAIDGMSLEAKRQLQTEFNIAKTEIINRSVKDEGRIISLVGKDEYLNAMEMAKYLDTLDLKESIKQETLNDNPDADTAIVEAEITENDEIKITSTAIKYEDLAKANGFETGTELVEALDSLVNITKERQSHPFYEDDLNPFESRETLISTLKNRKIPLSILKLAPLVNNIQEASYTNIGTATDYNALVEEAFSLGILTIDPNTNHIMGESQLIDFIFMMQPKKEHGTQDGLDISPASDKPSAYGLEDTINAKDAKAQNDASRQALATTNKLKDVLNDPTSDKIGLALNIAAKAYGIGKQYQQLTNLWNGNSSVFGTNLKVGDGSGDSETGGISENKRKEIGAEIAKAQSILESNLGEAAKKKAKMTLLKFTLAYQVSMALQGGSGGRTISDQDVDNILTSLQMPDTFFSTATRESTIASLDTLSEYLESIELQSRYLGQNTMKGYRAYVATTNVLSALNNFGGVGSDLEDLVEKMEERTGIGMTLTEEGGFDWNSEYNNYRSTWVVDFTANNVPVYVKMENGKRSSTEVYAMDEEDWNNFLTTAQSKNNNMFDNITPNFTTDISKELYKGKKLKGLFSDLLTQEEDLGV